MFNETQRQQLDQKLSAEHVKKHPHTGMDYIESWHAISEANRIFGFDGWSGEILKMEIVQNENKPKKNGSGHLFYIAYSCVYRINAGGVIRDGVGFGQGQDYDLGKSHESAIKEAESDALKRALRTFGNQFALALYDKTKANVLHQQEKFVNELEERVIEYIKGGGKYEDIFNSLSRDEKAALAIFNPKKHENLKKMSDLINKQSEE